MNEAKSKTEIGVSSLNVGNRILNADELNVSLRGSNGIKHYRHMRDDSPNVGAVMYAIEQTLRDIKWKVQPANDSEAAKKEAEFVEQVLEDMEHSLDDYISEATSFLTFGFVIHEIVYKRRLGRNKLNKKKHSKYVDGRLGVRKLAPRAPWTIREFVDIEGKGSEIDYIKQLNSRSTEETNIPYNKVIHIKTTTINGEPAGRSILRNSVSAWNMLRRVQELEIQAITREWNGVPVARIPSEYFAEDADDNQKLVKSAMDSAVRDLVLNEQAGMVLPSDTYMDIDGKPTNVPLVSIELLASQGTRNIDTQAVIKNYEHAIVRSVMAEFIMLGTEGGSYALSKTKNDLFFRSLESYINTIFDALNRQLIEQLWDLNALDYDLMPKLVPGDVAPHDLKDLGGYLRNLNGAGFDFTQDEDIQNHLLSAAEIPTPKGILTEKEEPVKEDPNVGREEPNSGDKPKV